jgi:hypothetical protein
MLSNLKRKEDSFLKKRKEKRILINQSPPVTFPSILLAVSATDFGTAASPAILMIFSA